MKKVTKKSGLRHNDTARKARAALRKEIVRHVQALSKFMTVYVDGVKVEPGKAIAW